MTFKREISIEVDGKIYNGTFTVEKGIITVFYGFKNVSTHTGPSIESLAKDILFELVNAELVNKNPKE